MSNNKQSSSLEQLAIALYENGFLQGNGDEIDDLLLHFKAMYKKEMCQFADEFSIECINFHHEKTMSPERFYELTFGGNQ